MNKDYFKDPKRFMNWIKFDGILNDESMDWFYSILSDNNKILMLNNGHMISILAPHNIFFEINKLSNVSPKIMTETGVLIM
jgi:hypothetical protein